MVLSTPTEWSNTLISNICQLTTTDELGYSRKKQTAGRGRGVEDMEFPGVEELTSGFFEGDQEKIMWNFQGSWFYGPRISEEEGCNTIKFCCNVEFLEG